MNIYKEFPMTTVIYNGITLAGMLVVGGIIAGQISILFLTAYILWGAAALVLTWATICSRCSYYGRRCGLLASGRITALVFKKGDETLYCRTKPQFLAVIIWGMLFVSGLLGAAVLAVKGSWLYPLIFFGLLLAVVMPHARLNCRHCGQAYSGACPIGRKLIKSGEEA